MSRAQTAGRARLFRTGARLRLGRHGQDHRDLVSRGLSRADHPNAHDIDEAILLSDRIVMMTNGLAARIGEVLHIALPRPRDRLALTADPQYTAYRQQLKPQHCGGADLTTIVGFGLSGGKVGRAKYDAGHDRCFR